MKTKIVYISGAETFNMTDVRAAFEEVRSALGLGHDTVLFGVPVDADDAFGQTVAPNAAVADAPEIPAEIINDAPAEIVADVDAPRMESDEIASAEIVADVAATPMDAPVDAPVARPAKKPRGRRRAVATDAPATDATPEKSDAAEKVVPILSVLAAKGGDDGAADDAPVDASVDAPVDTAPADVVAHTVSVNIDQVAIDDIISDDAPVAATEKTLEELLESMTPLGEDVAVATDVPATPIDLAADVPADAHPIAADADATLEQLAAEFAETQDKIPTTTKSDGHGKIGKLKNILPFKKAKREETGIMGDLFGWAGIAANDEEFSMPGFFTTASKK